MDGTHQEDDESPYDIRVSAPPRTNGVDHAELIRAIRVTLEKHGRRSCALSVALVDDATMAELHQRFLGSLEPTDVLAFDLGEAEDENVDGEIVISLETAGRQSRDRGHPLASEVMLYAVHGMLHLLGYDDGSEAEAQLMHARENEILTELGVGPIFGTRRP